MQLALMSSKDCKLLGMRPFFVSLSLLTSDTVHNILYIKANGTNKDKGKSKKWAEEVKHYYLLRFMWK